MIAGWRSAVQPMQLRLALQCATSLLIACIVMWLLPFPKPYWLALTALMVTANSLGETAEKSLERILGTALGLLAGTLVWVGAARVPGSAFAVLGVCVFAIFYERTARYRVMLFWLSLLLALIFHLADTADRLYAARAADTLIGAAIAVLVTVVLLPVRTGDAVRAQTAALLGLAAARLDRMASVLSQPGGHSRDTEIRTLLDAADKLAGLTAAEGVEAFLLRRPRLMARQRVAAAGSIGRGLLYADQLVPLLPGAEVGIPADLRALAAEMEKVARSVGDGSAAVVMPWRERMAHSREATAPAYHEGRITLAQYQASLRLRESLVNVIDAVERLAENTPAVPLPKRGLAGLASIR